MKIGGMIQEQQFAKNAAGMKRKPKDCHNNQNAIVGRTILNSFDTQIHAEETTDFIPCSDCPIKEKASEESCAKCPLDFAEAKRKNNSIIGFDEDGHLCEAFTYRHH